MVTFPTIKQWFLIGDHKQPRAVVQSTVANEFSPQADLSIFERLKNNNIEVFQLGMQSRMTPVCNIICNQLFYKNTIQTCEAMKRPNPITTAVKKFFK